MRSLVEMDILEAELSIYAPALDELKGQSKQFIDKISSAEQLENFIAFYQSFDDSND
jgi:hypothetical protein